MFSPSRTASLPDAASVTTLTGEGAPKRISVPLLQGTPRALVAMHSSNRLHTLYGARAPPSDSAIVKAQTGKQAGGQQRQQLMNEELAPHVLAHKPPSALQGTKLQYVLLKHPSAAPALSNVAPPDTFIGPFDVLPGLAPVRVPRSLAAGAGTLVTGRAVSAAPPAVACLLPEASSFPSDASHAAAPAPAIIAMPKLAPRLCLSAQRIALMLPAGFSKRVLEACVRRLEVDMCYKRSETDLGEGVSRDLLSRSRLQGAELHLQLHSGVHVMEEATVPLKMGSGGAGNLGGGMGGTLAIQDPAAAARAAEAAIPGPGAMRGSTMLLSDRAVLFRSYAPHPAVALVASVRFIVELPMLQPGEDGAQQRDDSGMQHMQ